MACCGEGQLDRAGPVNVGLVNNAIKSVRIIKKGYVTGVLLPEEVMNKAEYQSNAAGFRFPSTGKTGEVVDRLLQPESGISGVSR